MPAYLVSLPDSVVAAQLQDGIDTVVVYAGSTTDAKAMAKASMGADVNSLWDLAVVTEIAAATNILGFKFSVKETLPNGVVNKDVSITATGAGQDTIDEIGAALASALGGSYNSTTQVVQLAASGRGDSSLEVSVYPPTTTGQDAPIPGFIAAIAHRGASSDPLSFTLADDAFVVPALYAKCRLRRS